MKFEQDMPSHSGPDTADKVNLTLCMDDYQKGYQDALEDVEGAMHDATVGTIGPAGIFIYNDPYLFTEKLLLYQAQRQVQGLITTPHLP